MRSTKNIFLSNLSFAGCAILRSRVLRVVYTLVKDIYLVQYMRSDDVCFIAALDVKIFCHDSISCWCTATRLHTEVTGTKARTLITAAVRCTAAAILLLLYSTEYILLLLVCSFEAPSLLVKTNMHRSSWLISVPMNDESTRFTETYRVAGRPGGVSGYHSSSPV